LNASSSFFGHVASQWGEIVGHRDFNGDGLCRTCSGMTQRQNVADAWDMNGTTV